jgi:hypothetical protein
METEMVEACEKRYIDNESLECSRSLTQLYRLIYKWTKTIILDTTWLASHVAGNRNLKNEEAMPRVGPQRHKKKKLMRFYTDRIGSERNWQTSNGSFLVFGVDALRFTIGVIT